MVKTLCRANIPGSTMMQLSGHKRPESEPLLEAFHATTKIFVPSSKQMNVDGLCRRGLVYS